MNKIALGLSILSLAMAGVLFYLYFSKPAGARVKSNLKEQARTEAPADKFTMAYFEMDSVESNYEYVKEIRETLRRKEDQMNTRLNSMKNNFQKKIAGWQQKGPNISQAESEAMNREYQQMQMDYENEKQRLDENLKTEYQKLLMDVNKKISDFLKEYNKEKGYTYIITNESSLIYYKDSVYNITRDVVEGLNASYKKKAQKK
jgi:outer membrane protein